MYKNLKSNNDKFAGENSTASCLFSSALNVILRRERSELPGESRNIMAILLKEANSIAIRFFSVITGRDAQSVPVILVQRVTNLVNKFAILLHKYRFSQDCRNKSGNDRCWGRGLSICCHFLKRMYHPGSSANELTLKAKDDYKSVLQYGRSMIEMLGVLVIIAVLSVGGIAGYSKAMEKWKMNRTISEYGFLVNSFLEYRDNLKNSIHLKGGGSYGLVDFAHNVNIIPPTWKAFNQNLVTDSLGIRTTVYLGIDGTGKQWIVLGWFANDEAFDMKFCQTMMNDLAKPLHPVLDRVWFWGVRGSTYVYGDELCEKGRICLCNVTFSEIQEMCQSCLENRNCMIYIWF